MDARSKALFIMYQHLGDLEDTHESFVQAPEAEATADARNDPNELYEVLPGPWNS